LLVADAEPRKNPCEAGTHRDSAAETSEPGEPDIQMIDRLSNVRPPSRFVAPAPEATPERIEQVRRHRKSAPRMRQGQLPLEIISKGRFEKSEPTIHQGEDLDIPTYIRRHVSLN
jgi:cell division protein FtsZ